MTILNENAVKSPEDYVNCGGYKALRDVLNNGVNDNIITILKKFNVKVTHDLAESREDKYLICSINGSEVDRAIVENNPFSLIEGMTVIGFASGSNKGHIYINDELKTTIDVIKNSIECAKSSGYLGKNILNSNFNFDIELHIVKSDKYLFSEDLSLLTGSNNLKAVAPFEDIAEIWDKLTIINSSKTYAEILSALSGDEKILFYLKGVKKEGIVEVPVSSTLKDVIFNNGKGTVEGKEVKAINIGRNLGVFLPLELMNITFEKDTLKKHNIPLNFDEVEVIYEEDNILSIIDEYAELNKKNSCGKCIPCREGMTRISEIVKEINSGKNVNENREKLSFLCSAINDTALCEFGKNAVKPVETAIKYFI
jgi:NADH:ubiquinone oxidoreductase subunit F (NADH-binding)